MPAQGDCTSPSQCTIITEKDICGGCTTGDYCTGSSCQQVDVKQKACTESGCNYSVAPKDTVTIWLPLYTGPWSLVTTRPGQNPAEIARALGGEIVVSTPQAAILRVPGDPDTVKKLAIEKGFDVDVEPDYVMNKAL